MHETILCQILGAVGHVIQVLHTLIWKADPGFK